MGEDILHDFSLEDRNGPLNTEEVAQLFKRSPQTVRRWVKAGHLQPYKVMNQLHYSVDDLKSFIEEQL